MASESVGEVTGIMVIIHFVEPNEDDVNYWEMVYPWEIDISECIGAEACTFYAASFLVYDKSSLGGLSYCIAMVGASQELPDVRRQGPPPAVTRPVCQQGCLGLACAG